MNRNASVRWCSLILGALACASATVSAQESRPRQVAAPASDILAGVVRLPDPAATPTASRAAVIPLVFTRTSSATWIADVSLPIEASGRVAIAALSSDAGAWRISIGRDAASLRPIAQAFTAERRTGLLESELPGFVVDRYDLRDVPASEWLVRVEAPANRGASRPAPGWLLATTESDLAVVAHVSTLRLVAGEPIAVVASARSTVLAPRVDRAIVRIEAQGRVHELPMLDDGAHEDGAAGDGTFGAFVPDTVRGSVRAEVDLAGATLDGQRFLRSAMLSFPVLDQRTLFEGTVRVQAADDERLALELGAYALGPVQKVHVSTEVWGRDDAGRAVPVCWLSRQVEPLVRDGLWSLPLFLDSRWIDFAGAHAPFELRQVRVQDPDTEVVFDRLERVQVSARDSRVMELHARSIAARGGPREITSEMLTGGSSLTLDAYAHVSASGPRDFRAIAPALMLVHGYCSGGSVWPAADFSQPKLQFLDPNANRTHDQFAVLIDQRAQSAALSSFGIVAHSQGGPASLHLLTYYQSGLDLAEGGRRIQSVASPYQGTPLASLGAFACGVNDNMTPAGAATWLSGIPTWARAEVFTWTTANSGSACNFFTGLFLTDPEDGTVEKTRSELPSGNNMGHTTGWCHTTGMTNPANYTDHTRNQAMNAAAAR